MRQKKHPRSLSALSRRMGALLLAVWLACMVLLTWGTALYVRQELVQKGQELAKDAAHWRLDGWFDDSSETWRAMPGALAYTMNETIEFTRVSVSSPAHSFPGQDRAEPSLYRDVYLDCAVAVMFLDQEGHILRESGDYLYFPYYTEAQWLADDTDAAASSFGWIDLRVGKDAEDWREDPYTLLRTMYNGIHSLFEIEAFRITGLLRETGEIEPVAMAYLPRDAVQWAVEQVVTPQDVVYDEDGNMIECSYSYTVSGLDGQGVLEWQPLFDHTADAGAEALVTVYAEYPEMEVYEGTPVRYRDERHESLLALLHTMRGYQGSSQYAFSNGASRFDLWNTVVFSSWGVYDLRDYDETVGAPYPDAAITMMTAVQASPLKAAMVFLRNVYIWSFLAVLVGFLLLRSTVKRRLTDPLEALLAGVENDWRLAGAEHDGGPWREPLALRDACEAEADVRRGSKNEIARLTKALDYAKAAEENRRQLVSNLAHELKTPMAVIHSYAEGLREHIAEEKREQYLDVILSEAERADAMVLEMLDLSRLEAGRVKLARDEFDLAALVRSVLARLERPVEDRHLQVTTELPETCTVTADEARIAQVVENFLTNAVKYTPEGGEVFLRLQRTRGGTTFAVENSGVHLSAEALTKVWDSFYRADEARSGGGTGLGLAIARRIVELHGGTCAVYNTKIGVEFRFTI